MDKVAIYCRLSEEDKNKASPLDDSASIQNQKSLLIQYADKMNWKVFKVYSDDDYTGSDRNRPAFIQLIKDAEARKFDIILCKTQSRFTREMELVETYIHGLFPLWGIRFVSVVDNADTANKGNKKARQINGLINEWYLEDMSESIRSVLVNRRQNGYHIGSFALYGYKKDPAEKGRLLIDEEAAAIVREVFCLYAKGYGKTAIARVLNERNVPNPTEYKRLKGLRYQQPQSMYSTLWKYPAISEMLKNEMYIGNMVQGKYGSISYKTKKNRPRPTEQWYRVEHTHPPIIDYSLWEQVQIRLKERSKPFKNGEIGIFSGIAYCKNCGYALRSTKSHGKHYLTCPTRYVSKDACAGAFIPVEELKEIVVLEFSQFTDRYLNLEDLEAQIKTPDSQEMSNALIHQISELEKKLLLCSKALRSAYFDKMKGLLNQDQYMDFSQHFSEEQSKLSHVLKEKRDLLESVYQYEGKNDKADLIRFYVSTSGLDREMVNFFIKRIDVGKRETRKQDVPVTIHWKF